MTHFSHTATHKFGTETLRKVKGTGGVANIVKCVLLGDHGVGKQTFQNKFADGVGDDVVNTNSQTRSRTMNVNGKFLRFDMFLPEWISLNSYPSQTLVHTHVVILMYSATKPSTVRSLKEIYVPFLQTYDCKARIVVIGTHADEMVGRISKEQQQEYQKLQEEVEAWCQTNNYDHALITQRDFNASSTGPLSSNAKFDFALHVISKTAMASLVRAGVDCAQRPYEAVHAAPARRKIERPFLNTDYAYSLYNAQQPKRAPVIGAPVRVSAAATASSTKATATTVATTASSTKAAATTAATTAVTTKVATTVATASTTATKAATTTTATAASTKAATATAAATKAATTTSATAASTKVTTTAAATKATTTAAATKATTTAAATKATTTAAATKATTTAAATKATTTAASTKAATTTTATATRASTPATAAAAKTTAAPAPATSAAAKATPAPATGAAAKATPAPATSAAAKATPAPATGAAAKATPAPATGAAAKGTPAPATAAAAKATSPPSTPATTTRAVTPATTTKPATPSTPAPSATTTGKK